MRVTLAITEDAIIRRMLQIVSVLVVTIAGFYFLANYEEPNSMVIDHRAFQVAIDEMRAGEDYYAAYDIGIREVYGPMASVRDARLPTLYAGLALLPPGSEHVTYALMAVIAGIVAVSLASFPPSGILVTIYLLTLAVSDDAAQFLYTELWVVPVAIAAVYAIDRGHYVVALSLGMLAFAIREQGILLLGGIALYSWKKGRHRVTAAGLVVAATLGYVLHMLAVWTFIDPEHGSHTPLNLGWDPLESLLRTVGMGIGVGWIGLIFVTGAFVWAHRHRQLLAIGFFLAVPLLTVWANRPYWGVMVTPLSVVLSIDLIWEFVLDRSQARKLSPTHARRPGWLGSS